ncbi:MAG: antibiotic biosynthesis monooxygenase [Hyphomonadaceae bacterium]|nr:antibiotic biosynthesis monooxygenase [Hyphomonadaceae bacterium]
MTAFIARLVVKPDRAKEFEALQTELRNLTHASEPEAYVYELWQSQEDAHTYFCLASFRDQEAFDRHMTIDFHDRLVPPILECLASDMELTLCNIIGPGRVGSGP